MDKDAKDMADAMAEKKNEKIVKIQTNIKNNEMELGEKARVINSKWRKMEKKVDNAE